MHGYSHATSSEVSPLSLMQRKYIRWFYLILGSDCLECKKKEQSLLTLAMFRYSVHSLHNFKCMHYFMSNPFAIAPFLTTVITFPITGIVADTCVRRFKIVQVSVSLLTASSLLKL